jgi:Tfp pilus assembly protein PilO
VSALRARLQVFWAGLQVWYAGHSVRDQRVILSVLTFAALSVVYLWGWLPLRDYRQSLADEVTEGQEQLKRSVRIVRSADSLRAERESLEKKLAQARQRLLPGRGATLGAAALQERANALAAEKGITVQSTQVMKDEALDPYRKVAIRLTLSGELRPFAELVSALEFGQQLSIPFVEVNRRGVAPGAKGPRTLSATMEVSGFVLAEDAKVDEGGGVEGAPEAAAAAAGDGTAPPQGTPPQGAPSPTTGPGAPAASPPNAPAANPPAPPTTPPGKGGTPTSTPPPAQPGTTATTRPVPTLPPIVPKTPPRPAPAAPAEETD